MTPNLFKNFFTENQDPNKFKDLYVRELKQLLLSFESIDLVPIINKIVDTHKANRKIITFGNGGSAANATHFCVGMSYVSRLWVNPLRSINLAQDANLLSSLANDHGFENIFVRQLQVMLEPGDLVFAFSVSGKSENVIRAAEYAKSKDAYCVGFTGLDGGKLKPLVDFSVHFQTQEILQGLTEDCHMVFGHMLAYYLELRLK